MTRNETSQFIRAQVAASGVEPDELFVGDVSGAVFEATDGVPRLVNQLCDRALVMADGQNVACVDRDLVQAAWSDLQQLPTPWETPTSTLTAARATDVIEFGSLSDEQSVEIHPVADMAEIDPTELDVDDLAQELPMPSAAVEFAQMTARRTGDPFGEQFEEEEVVLDNFAAWDNMCLHERIRVENRRDPGFASLVQDAINASAVGPVDADTSSAESLPSARLMPVPSGEDTDEFAAAEEPNNEFGDASILTEMPAYEEHEVPPLRLADVPDLAPLTSVPFIAPSPITNASVAAFDPVLPEDDDVTSGDWLATFAVGSARAAQTAQDCSMQVLNNAPILVIEEDPADRPGRGPEVRRQEYRNLFSRLRSG
jgi:hypothetical protein